MNYYAHGGQAHGLKTLASELPKHGRYGDTIVAHINPQEAALLKSLGGSGTINPTTGLPEFWGGLGALNPFNPGSGINRAINQVPVIGDINKGFSDLNVAIMKPIDQALVGLDKTVGKTIPGGWGTVGMIAGSAMGLPTWAMTGLGALNGSGMLRPGGKFNMQGALMGGAMAYGMAELGDYVRSADISGATPTPTVDVPVTAAPVAAPTPSTDFIGSFAGPNPPTGGDFVGSFSGPNPSMGTSYTPPPAPTYMENVAQTGRGLKSLVTEPSAATAQANAALASSGTTSPGKALLATGTGAMGLSDLEAQRNYEKDATSANNAANAEWNNIMAGIEANRKRGEDVVMANPYRYASGGMMPRFLSGGGDGLSDDIDATIEGKQPAKLADGEFVVSADVVSGLGGGSSKAGAKKLYSMMDRVRQQAHGTKKQVRKVSNKALPA